jgi:hypothetical protein
LGAKLRELEASRETAGRELDDLNRRRTRIEELERDKASLLNDSGGNVFRGSHSCGLLT